MEEVKSATLKIKDAKILYQHKKYDEAEITLKISIESLEKLEENDEKNKYLSEAYNDMGLILYKKVEFERAQTMFNKSIQVNPSLAAAFYNRGLVSYRLGSFENADKDIEKAVALEPENKEFVAGLRATKKMLNNTPGQ